MKEEVTRIVSVNAEALVLSDKILELKSRVLDLEEMLEVVLDTVDKFVDIRDTEDGQTAPNWAMNLSSCIEDLLLSRGGK